MRARVLTSLLIFSLIILTPWWVYLPALIIVTFIFPFFWEGVVFALLIDTLYGYKTLPAFGFPVALLESILIVAFLPIRKLFRFNA